VVHTRVQGVQGLGTGYRGGVPSGFKFGLTFVCLYFIPLAVSVHDVSSACVSTVLLWFCLVCPVAVTYLHVWRTLPALLSPVLVVTFPLIPQEFHPGQ